jgi:polysaccharide export outer membrane protein
MRPMRDIAIAWVLCLTAAAGACSPSAAIKQHKVFDDAAAVAQPYRIEPDDVLDVMVWKQPQVSGKVNVAADGTITVPLADNIHAAGLTIEQLQAELTRRLAPFIADPTVTVRMADARSQVIYVMGAVQRPGVFRLRPGEVLSQALAEAGGFTEFADSGSVRITRHIPGDAERIVINYDRVMSGKDLSADVTLMAGDTVDVP